MLPNAVVIDPYTKAVTAVDAEQHWCGRGLGLRRPNYRVLWHHENQSILLFADAMAELDQPFFSLHWTRSAHLGRAAIVPLGPTPLHIRKMMQNWVFGSGIEFFDPGPQSSYTDIQHGVSRNTLSNCKSSVSTNWINVACKLNLAWEKHHITRLHRDKS